MGNQKTIAKKAIVSGVGLHTASKTTLTFKPAGVDEGITFVRTDMPAAAPIKATVDYLVTLTHGYRRTSIGSGDAEIHTIEHLMAALSGLGIDNITIDIDNKEVPGMDGSSNEFVKALKNAGVVEQEKPRKEFVVREPVIVQDEHAYIIAVPAPDFRVSYTLSFNHPLLRAQFLDVTLTNGTFEQELGSARTFCLEDEALHLKNQGLGLGADYTNTLVVGKEGVIKNTLRFQDEFVRHKVLDLVGDLYLLGTPIKGHIMAVKSGHALNLKLVSKLKALRDKQETGAIKIQYQSEFGTSFGAEEIMKILPHRTPFLFVDRVLSLEQGKRITAIKNVTMNDYFFDGHFPGRPVMPGVIIIEAMAQAGGIMMLSASENKGKIAYFMAMNGIKFRKTVVPGDQLVFEVEVLKFKSKTGVVYGKALVDGKVAAEGELMFALVEA